MVQPEFVEGAKISEIPSGKMKRNKSSLNSKVLQSGSEQ
jgi:hypothetical protein